MIDDVLHPKLGVVMIESNYPRIIVLGFVYFLCTYYIWVEVISGRLEVCNELQKCTAHEEKEVICKCGYPGADCSDLSHGRTAYSWLGRWLWINHPFKSCT